jgi:hypothetical protein
MRCEDDTVSAVDGTRRRIATRLAWVVAVGFVLVLAAGADRPPPPGFIRVVVLAAVLGVLVRVLLPQGLARWSAAGPRSALARAGAVGALVSVLIWGAASLAPGGDPSVDVGTGARIIGLVVACVLGMLVATGVLTAGRVLQRRTVGR